MRFLLKILVLLFLSSPIIAQVSFEKRLEIDLKEDDFKNHELYDLGANGFLIRAEGKKSIKGLYVRYSLYDNELNLNKEINELLSIKKSS